MFVKEGDLQEAYPKRATGSVKVLHATGKTLKVGLLRLKQKVHDYTLAIPHILE